MAHWNCHARGILFCPYDRGQGQLQKICWGQIDSTSGKISNRSESNLLPISDKMTSPTQISHLQLSLRTFQSVEISGRQHPLCQEPPAFLPSGQSLSPATEDPNIASALAIQYIDLMGMFFRLCWFTMFLRHLSVGCPICCCIARASSALSASFFVNPYRFFWTVLIITWPSACSRRSM